MANQLGNMPQISQALTGPKGKCTTFWFKFFTKLSQLSIQYFGTANQIQISGSGVVSIVDNPILPGTQSVSLPSGTTAQRPTAADSQIRYNVQLDDMEYSRAGVWTTITSAYTPPLTTKGDLFTYSNQAARLPAGANNTALFSNSAMTTGLEWRYVSKVLGSEYMDVGNNAGVETVLYTISLPPNQLRMNGDVLNVHANIVYAANNNVKTINLYLNNTLITSFSSAFNDGQTSLSYEIYRVSANAQRIVGEATTTDSGGTTVVNFVEDLTENLAATLVVKITGESLLDNDVVGKTYLLEYLPND
jgi:hypothetical protein